MIELIIVLLVLSIFMVIATRFSSPKLYKADVEGNKVIEVLREARERAVLQNKTIRVELNKTRNTIRVIAEQDPTTGADDKVFKELRLSSLDDVKWGAPPENMSQGPQENTPVPELEFKNPVTFEASHPPPNHADFATNSVATLRFLGNGNVVDAGINEIGTGSIITGATIFFWTPIANSNGTISNDALVLRAITLTGNSGSSRYWKCGIGENGCSDWQD